MIKFEAQNFQARYSSREKRQKENIRKAIFYFLARELFKDEKNRKMFWAKNKKNGQHTKNSNFEKQRIFSEGAKDVQIQRAQV